MKVYVIKDTNDILGFAKSEEEAIKIVGEYVQKFLSRSAALKYVSIWQTEIGCLGPSWERIDFDKDNESISQVKVTLKEVINRCSVPEDVGISSWALNEGGDPQQPVFLNWDKAQKMGMSWEEFNGRKID